ncbi:hypothetical protein V757_04595 [Pelistega indica]|uniref:Copper chaperone PCu(A)C n=1 Tax=Pelistega indica TaxID=1414851 RepID=V8G8F5_9BURK|nr:MULTISPECIES: copper chaperone PCu(A)C [Pelistega]ETD72391.1 hypothetical protein V757_04595 [Pelistega indica]
MFTFQTLSTISLSLFAATAVMAHNHQHEKMSHDHQHHHASATVSKESAEAVEFSQCWIRFSEQGSSALYMKAKNNDVNKPAYLVGAKSDAFEHIMLHESYQHNGMTGMRHLNEIEVPAGKEVVFTPGSYHLMLMSPKAVKVGDNVHITFSLSNGHELSTQCLVKPLTAKSFGN